jgi:hypothetical protein
MDNRSTLTKKYGSSGTTSTAVDTAVADPFGRSQVQKIVYGYTPNTSGGYDFFAQNAVSGAKMPVTREVYAANMGGSYPTDVVPGTTGQIATPTQTAAAPVAVDTAAQQQAAAVAADAAQKSGLRSGIQNLISQAKDIYGSLYGGLTKQAASEKGQLESAYAKNLQDFGSQYASELPKIAQAYAARGAYDSTWRAGAEQAAQQGYQTQLGQLSQAQQEALGKVGQRYAETQGQYQAGQAGLETILGRLGSVTDINDLTSLRNQIENKIIEINAAKAGQLTQEQQLAQTQGLGSVSDKFSQASQTIDTIINGQAPVMLKKSIASQIVGSAGLSESEQKQLLDKINAIA